MAVSFGFRAGSLALGSGGGGGTIPSELQANMDAVFNKKFDTSGQTYDSKDWPDTVNLMGPLPEKTVSGAVAVIEDGADAVPCKNVVATIAPNLDGVSSVTVTRTGRNLANIGAVESCTNTGGVGSSITQNNDGTITIVTGTQQNVKSLQKFNDIFPNVKVGETCRLSAVTTGTQKQIYLHGVSTVWTFNTSKTITAGMLTSDISFYASGANGTTALISDFQLEYGSTTNAYEQYKTPATYTAQLGRTVYGGTVDIVNGTGTDENDDPFTFTGQEVDTRLGYNAFWSDSGDTEVTYRASGTITPVVPTLITKTITANDTYSAASDEADGYSSVTVDVQPNVGTKSITENGTYAASADSLDGYSSVTVDVSAGTDLFNLASQTTFDLTDNTYKTSALTIPERMFNGNQRIRTVNLSGVKTVENYAFYSCKATSISLPDVETIGYQAFWQARGATDVPLSIPNVVSIGEEAFKEAYVCGESTSNRFLDISKCVSIGHNAFRSTRINGFDLSSAETFGNCPWFSGQFSMTTALFPKIKTAGEQLLRGCTFTNLVMGPDWESCGSGLAGYDADWPNRYIYIYAVNPPVMAGGLSISRRPVAFYVPAESVDAYKAAPYWSDYASIILPLPDDHLTIDTWLT